VPFLYDLWDILRRILAWPVFFGVLVLMAHWNLSQQTDNLAIGLYLLLDIVVAV